MDWTYEEYLEQMKHIKWKGSGYRVMTREEFIATRDWLAFVDTGVLGKIPEPKVSKTSLF